MQLHLYMEMLKVFGLDWMLQDEEWKDAVWAADNPKTGEYWDKLHQAVQSKTLAEWNDVFEHDHNVWAETMRRGSELLDHPQMRGLLWSASTTPSVGRCASRVRSSRCGRPRPSRRGAPVLDADGPAVRAEPWVWPWPRARRGRAGSAPDGRALGDVTLLEIGTFFAAPFVGTVLRELGARVLKVEPIDGEPMRTLLVKMLVGNFLKKCITIP